MPSTESISLPVSACFIGSMMGMPPPTLASKATSTPWAAAASNISLPRLAMTALFAVTTCLPAESAPKMTSAATPVPPISSTTMSTSGFSTTACQSSTNAPSGTPASSARCFVRLVAHASSRVTPRWRA